MGILKPTQYYVKAEGSLVELKIGDAVINMDYRTALNISTDMRIIAKQAKANAGDTSVDLKAKGLLTDANEDEKRRVMLRDATASFR